MKNAEPFGENLIYADIPVLLIFVVMQAIGNSLEADRVEADGRFNVVVAYEDMATSKRALRTCDLVARTLGSDVEVSRSMWKFDVLQMPGMRELATSDAADADMIIVSAHNQEIPLSVRNWIEESPASMASHPRALVALLDGATEDEISSSLLTLQQLAADRNMEFFVRSDAGEN